MELLRRVNMRERYRRYRSTLTNSNHWHQSGEALSCMAAPYITAGLERFNRVASLFGVEPRPPFTDRDLIEFQAWRCRSSFESGTAMQSGSCGRPCDRCSHTTSLGGPTRVISGGGSLAQS
ncbi:MAG: hypothetical protein IPP21_11320 [Betaproteobacteria bacterium]|nr:hypothetical protein [Betaproteobacteria bacterium]